MGTEDLSDPPAAVPWYKSAVLRGVLTILVTQLLNAAQKRYDFDASVFGLTVNEIVSYVMDIIALGGLGQIVHGRVTQKSAPSITATKSKADEINAVTPPAPIQEPQ